MALQVGIIGLPNVGKSTLFKALTRKNVDISNYPFCTIEPNVGIVEVPDERLNQLAKISQSQKIVSAVVEFVDIAGLVKGASQGEGLGNKFLASIREVDVIVHVVRIFANDTITHVHNTIDPMRDIEIIETELILADLHTIEKTITRLEKMIRGGDKDASAQLSVVQQIKDVLDLGQLARTTNLESMDANTQLILREMALLSMKPILYIYNMMDGDKLSQDLQSKFHIQLDIKIEEELAEVSPQEAKELGMQSHLNEVITTVYDLLNLITYFTTGDTETHAWTIKNGATAPEAGSAIHTDFQQKFICADVVFWEDFIDVKSWSGAREQGLLQTVGKDYIVRDGDIIEFKV